MKFVLGILASLLSVSLAQAEVCKVKLSRRHHLWITESSDGKITVHERIRRVSRAAMIFASIDESLDVAARELGGGRSASSMDSQDYSMETTEYAPGAVPYALGVYSIPHGDGIRFDVKSRKVTLRGRVYRCR